MFMRISFILLIFYIIISEGDGATIKKSIGKSTLGSPKFTKIAKSYGKIGKPKPPPALIAIEIIDDPNSKNSTKGNSKRTIDGSLGYGSYNYVPTRKFVIYKYSQQDIPPLPGNYYQNNYYNTDSHQQNNYNHHHDDHGSTSVDIVPSRLVYQQDEQPQAPYYHQDQSGYYPNQDSYQTQAQPPQGAVPVILLRVYSNQLTNPHTALHTNLPQSNPYASLNNVNLQSLLQNYLQNYLHQQQHHQQAAVPQYQVPAVANYHEQQVQNHHQQQQHVYQAPQQTYEHGHEHGHGHEHENHPNLPTFENYPSHQHTRVIFHSNNNGHVPHPNTLAYSKVTVPTYRAPQPTYPEDEPDQADGQYAYPTGEDGAQQYTYGYPNQDYVQHQQEQNYQAEQDYQQQGGNEHEQGAADEQYQQQQDEQQYAEQPTDQQYQQPSEQHYQQETNSDYQVNSHQESTLRESEHDKGPYNYHAHSDKSPKLKRSKKSKDVDSSKVRQERDKTT